MYYVDEQRYATFQLLNSGERLTAQGLDFSLCSITNTSDFHLEFDIHFGIFPFKNDLGSLEANQ